MRLVDMWKMLCFGMIAMACGGSAGPDYNAQDLRTGYPLFSLEREPGCLTAWVDDGEACRVTDGSGEPRACVEAVSPIVLVPVEQPAGVDCPVMVERGCGHCGDRAVEAVFQYRN